MTAFNLNYTYFTYLYVFNLNYTYFKDSDRAAQ